MFSGPAHLFIPPVPTDALRRAYWAATYSRGSVSIDEWWMMRDVEQNEANKRRREDWEVRFKVLGPRPQDMRGKA